MTSLTIVLSLLLAPLCFFASRHASLPGQIIGWGLSFLLMGFAFFSLAPYEEVLCLLLPPLIASLLGTLSAMREGGPS